MNLLKTTIIIILIMLGIYFLFGCESPTEPTFHINIAGNWNAENIELKINQEGINLTGEAFIESKEYKIIGTNENYERIFIQMASDEEEIVFAGAVDLFITETKMYAFPKTIKGTIKRGQDVRAISLNKVTK